MTLNNSYVLFNGLLLAYLIGRHEGSSVIKKQNSRLVSWFCVHVCVCVPQYTIKTESACHLILTTYASQTAVLLKCVLTNYWHLTYECLNDANHFPQIQMCILRWFWWITIICVVCHIDNYSRYHLITLIVISINIVIFFHQTICILVQLYTVSSAFEINK